MNRSKLNLSNSKLVPKTQPVAVGWSVGKASTLRVSPYNKQETSQLLKGDVSKPSLATLKNRRDSSNKANKKLFGAVHAALVQDSRNFNDQLKALEPTIKSLSPRLQNKTKNLSSNQNQHEFRKPRSRPKEDVSPLFSDEDLSIVHNIGALPPPFQGEKLITIGGYIVSLQTAPANITSSIRPRVSSDKDGFELEIKIVGCQPSDLKYEKRYNTLIVIGISNATTKKLEERKSTPLGTMIEGKSKQKDEREVKSAILGAKGNPNQSLTQADQMDDMVEIINIFVPKNVPINQIFISKPDTKGRIFVKGP